MSLNTPVCSPFHPNPPTHTQPCRNMKVGLSPRLLTLNLIWFQSHRDGQMDTVQFLEFLTFSAFAGSCCCLSRFYRLSSGISTPIGGRDCCDIISAGFPLWLALKPLSPTLSSSLRLQTNSNRGSSWTCLNVRARVTSSHTTAKSAWKVSF